MKNAIIIFVLAALMLSLFSGIVAEEVTADETYVHHSNEHSNEHSDGPGESTEGNTETQNRAVQCSRNKDN